MLFAVLIMLCSLTVAAGVVFATPEPARGGPASTCPATEKK
ncbi:hypothetical protein [Nonomuraea sp. LPB2021202275-12-8]